MSEAFAAETQPKWIVHLCQKADWQTAREQGVYQAASLGEVGFIHCSRPDQVAAVANRFYAGCPNLVLLWIDPNRLEADLRWEAADADLFPHIYGPLNLEAVRAITDFPAGPDGHFVYDPVDLD
jgi:uncharacterized protein (DUF952 family)